jgi:hypothetical protein
MSAAPLSLRPYQRETIDAVLAARRAGVRRMLVCLPTGSGKTVIFSELARLARRGVLVIAHREELLEQARAKLQAALGDPQVVAGTLGDRQNLIRHRGLANKSPVPVGSVTHIGSAGSEMWFSTLICGSFSLRPGCLESVVPHPASRRRSYRFITAAYSQLGRRDFHPLEHRIHRRTCVRQENYWLLRLGLSAERGQRRKQQDGKEAPAKSAPGRMARG